MDLHYVFWSYLISLKGTDMKESVGMLATKNFVRLIPQAQSLAHKFNNMDAALTLSSYNY